MRDEPREVTTFCPRCGQPFVLEVGRLRVGHEVNVDAWVRECALTEDEYEELCDRAVALAGADRDELRRQAAPAPFREAPPLPTQRDTPDAPAPAGGFRARVRRVFGGE